ncbi:hypothetical protein CRENPOLYSF1_100019 [Crenothrix polyspora]|uniref:Uncharacterized protein n=1 Tax=Crenothrix polyspora TaxID=360316 RepID=A0A1R4GZU2_9GAMM|nr:hypothetical protein CRENPOLYSF1_100019 [Crenothrix polyspora]
MVGCRYASKLKTPSLKFYIYNKIIILSSYTSDIDIEVV